jgi:hypothetical protein
VGAERVTIGKVTPAALAAPLRRAVAATAPTPAIDAPPESDDA